MISTGFAPFSLIFLPFMALFLLSAYGVWRRSRIGYVISTALSALFLVLEGTQIVSAIGAVTIPNEFLSVITAVPVLVAVLIYSILGLRQFWRKGMQPASPRMMPASTLVILLALGFIFGGITVGLVAAQTETRLLNSVGSGDVTIVSGAGNQNNPQFYLPSTFPAKVGVPVTWANHDGTGHTVTSKDGTWPDSGNINTGETYQHTFNQPGTYDYYCTYHPWMTGKIVVASG
jgi:plastocyanin